MHQHDITLSTGTQGTVFDSSPTVRKEMLKMSFLFITLTAFGIVLNIQFTDLLIWLVLVAQTMSRRIQAEDVMCIFLLVGPVVEAKFLLGLPGMPDMHLNRLVALLLAAIVIKTRSSEALKPKMNYLDMIFASLAGFQIFTIVFGIMYKTPLRLWIDSFLVPMIFYVFAKTVANRTFVFQKLYLIVTLILLLLSCMGVVERVTARDLLPVPESNFIEDQEVFRVNGPFRMAETYGMVLSYYLILFSGLRNSLVNCVRKPWVARVIILVSFIAVAATNTRQVWISCATGLFIVHFMQNKHKVFISFITLSIFLLAFLAPTLIVDEQSKLYQERINNKETIYARLATFESAYKIFEDNPLLGVGYGCFTEAYERNPLRYETTYKDVPSVRQPHSSYLSLLAETGVFGFMLYVLSIFAMGFLSIKTIRKSKKDDTVVRRSYAETTLGLVAAYALAGLSLDMAHEIGCLNIVFFSALGLLSGLNDDRIKSIAKSPTLGLQAS